ncbi:PEP phosphonomutase [Kribbella flavida DSM 17836]|uniref:PEP phosphonomutase n=1 Tax=Kribbella flavida (strain DSM 17836 / JCM 10339 / NBRC 14399) TaxID=479435 RepID=D2PPK1_KRIFD|nr:isocitrate lyase/phosphoenolpyruvate mutase family protein [Kribbella flavida]ADB30963.1 PEP phosphonomutase [Kribbella flavida DSM 17836]
MTLQDKASALRALDPLVLPNAWDAASAVVIAEAGAPAIATTSGGVAWSLGRPDGQALTRAEMVEQVRRIVAAVDVPVTADIEGGYGPRPDDVAKTITAVVDAGAVGVNLEDSVAPGGPLFPTLDQVARVAAARSAAVEAGLPELLINARTDVFLFGVGAPEGRLDEVLAHASAYGEAGADSLFVPGLVELDVVAELVRRSPLPVNLMAGPGAPKVAEFLALGVRRVSVGTSVAQAAYSVALRAARELLAHGTYTELDDAADFGTLNAYFSR